MPLGLALVRGAFCFYRFALADGLKVSYTPVHRGLLQFQRVQKALGYRLLV